MCVPLLIIFLTIAQAEEGVGHMEPVRMVVEEIGVGAAAGVVAGALGAWVLRMFTRRGWMEGTWRQIDAAATALLAYTLAAALGELDWPIALYGVASLTLVRMLPVALAMAGTGLRRVTVGFLGWFGPRGLTSIVFVLILLEGTELPERPLMLTVVTWTVALSVYAHGLTARPGATRYADWYHARHEHHGVMPESVPVSEQRPRVPALHQRR